MAKLLDGREIAGYIKQRHYQQARGLRPKPRLAILHASNDPATETYIKVKQAYASDIGIETEVYQAPPTQEALVPIIKQLNRDKTTTGIILQLPLPDPKVAVAAIQAIDPARDVDGLNPQSSYDSATATGILWLLSGYAIDLRGKTVAVIGQGSVGKPTSELLRRAGAKVLVADEQTKNLAKMCLSADIIVGAAGQAGLIKPEMVKPGAVVIDAGISMVEGRIAGDADPALMSRDDVAITPNPGGVGPMTVAALFDNLLRAAVK
jgi:methylenetetrahydrofolate dehydrogenase (NADP+) / methenyltetrahydrofolate cyclohydrolase